MAKRRRLTPANPAFLEPAPETKSMFSAPMRAPIAEVARETSAAAAVEELSRSLSEAREQGRMVVAVPLDSVQLDYLVRDRVVVDDDEMQALKDSLRARGQQTPVDLVALAGGRYGLISGWRRCAALRALWAETGEDRFAQVMGLLRQPAEQADAYLAMVEENEIRVGLSYFERARIVEKSVERGVFVSDREALQTLFQSASRAKRSKIGSFLPVVRALDGSLRFPEALGERQGVALGRLLSEEEGLALRLRQALAQGDAATPEAEVAVIEGFLDPARPVPSPDVSPDPSPSTDAPRAPAAEPPAAPVSQGDPAPGAEPVAPRPVVGGVAMTAEEGRIVLEGRRVDAAFRDRLMAWIRQTC